jgi:hypothetical protein
MLIRNKWICFSLVVLSGFGAARADDLQTLSSETTQLYAKHLVELFEKENPGRQSKFEVDPALARGLHSDQDGIILVPAKGLKDDTIDPAVESENGAGLCYLFLSPCYSPMADGKAIDAKKLHRITFKNGQGGDQEAICLVVTVKHKAGDDWRLFGFGGEKTPIIDSQFGESTADVDKPVAVTVSSVKDKKANLALTLFKKYSASFAIGAK